MTPGTVFQKRNRKFIITHIAPAPTVMDVVCSKCRHTPHCNGNMFDNSTGDNCEVCHCPICRGKDGQNVVDIATFHKLEGE